MQDFVHQQYYTQKLKATEEEEKKTKGPGLEKNAACCTKP